MKKNDILKLLTNGEDLIKASKKFEYSYNFEVPLFKLIQNNSLILKIPSYQRYFNWTWNKIDYLSDELHTTFKSNKVTKTEFKKINLGTITTVNDSKKHMEILDGQQRIISIFLIFFAFITLVFEEEDKITPTLLGEYNTTIKHLLSIISSSSLLTDKDVFSIEYIQKEYKLTTTLNDLISILTKGSINNLSKQEKNKYLLKIQEIPFVFNLRKKFNVKELYLICKGYSKIFFTLDFVNDDSEVHRKFQRMNTLAKLLTSTDKLRNYLFIQIDDDKKRKKILKLINLYGKDNLMFSYCIQKNNKNFIKISDSKLFDHYLNLPNKEKNKILKNIEEYSTFEKTGFGNNELKYFGKLLKLLNYKQLHRFLFLVSSINKKNLNPVLKEFKKIIVFASWSKYSSISPPDIRNVASKNISKTGKLTLNKLIQNLNLLKYDWINYTIKEKTSSQMNLLNKIIKQKNMYFEEIIYKLLYFSSNSKKLTLEHIFPQSMLYEEKSFIKSIYSRGNFVMIPENLNKSLRDSQIEEKIPKYKDAINESKFLPIDNSFLCWKNNSVSKGIHLRKSMIDRHLIEYIGKFEKTQKGTNFKKISINSQDDLLLYTLAEEKKWMTLKELSSEIVKHKKDLKINKYFQNKSKTYSEQQIVQKYTSNSNYKNYKNLALIKSRTNKNSNLKEFKYWI